MTIINSKTIARLASIQALYLYKNEDMPNIDRISDKIISLYNSGTIKEELSDSPDDVKIKLHKNFFTNLFHTTINNIDLVDKEITENLADGWLYENLHDNLKSILRAGVTEILFFPDIPPKVIVNEYTNIASDMIQAAEVGFVNSLLDHLTKKLRNNETQSHQS